MSQHAVRAAVLVAGLAACGDRTAPTVYDNPLDLSGAWHLADSTVYDITNISDGADGLRHLGAYIVTGNAHLTRLGEGSYSADLAVVITWIDSVPGSAARRTPQSVAFLNPIVMVNDTLFGVAAGGDIVPPAANVTASLIAWSYDELSERCRTTIASFHPATAACRQSVRWRR